MFKGKAKTRSNIQEANKHLQALYERVSDLESAASTQADEFSKRECELQSALRVLSEARETDIAKLKIKLSISEQERQKLLTELEEKKSVISHLEKRCEILDNILSFHPVLSELLSIMRKDQTVAEGSSIPTDENIATAGQPDVISTEHTHLDSDLNHTIDMNTNTKDTLNLSVEEPPKDISSVCSSEDQTSSFSQQQSVSEQESPLDPPVNGNLKESTESQDETLKKTIKILSPILDPTRNIPDENEEQKVNSPNQTAKSPKQSNGLNVNHEMDDTFTDTEEDTLPDNKDTAVEDQPSIQQLTKRLNTNSRNFSISDEEQPKEDRDTVLRKMKRNKELYL